MKHTIVYTSDVHGNEVQYQLLFEYATQVKADSVIIGGDIAPKGMPVEYLIESQRRFLAHRLPELIEPWKKACPSSRLFLMMGNDDAVINMDVLEQGDEKLYYLLHLKRRQLTNKLNIMGYSCVPITPFPCNKDMEKHDWSNCPAELAEEYELRKKNNYNYRGWVSTANGEQDYIFPTQAESKNSIEKDLSDENFKLNPDKTVYVIHTPPSNTNLDLALISKDQVAHVGSMALRQFIEQHQPYLTLHGHIHETVDVSGEFKESIGQTLCMSSGNHNVGKSLAIVVFDLYHPEEAERKIISSPSAI